MKVITDAGVIEIGTTETAPTIGLTDYSRRETDAFGVTTVVKRNFSRTMSTRVMVPTANVDALQRQLAALRAKPVQWVADDRFDSLSITGFYKDLSIDLAIPPVSYCTLTIEGLAEGADYADPGTDPATDQRKSTLRLLRPASIDDAVLTSSNVPENDYPAWSASATYALGVRVTLAATHRIYESAANGNVGNDPTGGAGQWIDIGPTNRWAMFDQALGSQTERAGSIVVSLDPLDPIDAVALLDVTAASVRVQASGYDRTLSPAIQPGAVTFLDLPATAGAVVITISGSGTVSAGTLLIGKLLGLGTTEASPRAAITDYSRKDTDAFGEVTVVERAWAKRMDVKSLISTSAVDVVAARIANVRAMPALWIGDATLESLAIYGFFKDFSIAVDEHVSTLSLSIEGLSTAAKLAPLGADVGWSDIKDDDPAHPKPEDGATVGATPEQVEQIADAQFTADAAAVAVAAAQAQIAAIEGSVAADIGALADQIGSVSASVGELVLEVGAVATDVSALTDNVGTIAADLVALSSQVGTVAIDVDGLKADILAAGGAIASLESNVSTQGASIATLQQATSSIGGDLATLTTRVTAGSANLLRTGGLDAGTLDWATNGVLSLEYSASFGRWLRVTSGAANFFINSLSVQVDPGGAYTASVDTIFEASAGTMIASLVWLNSGGAEVGRVWAGNRGGHSFDNSNAGRATNAASGIAPANAAGALLQVSWNNVAGLVNAGLRQAKIENYSTWTPFSSEASIRSAYTAISTLDTQYAGLSTTVGTQGASIVQNATAITNLTGRTASLESNVSAQGASIVTLQQATSTQGGQIAQLTTDLSTANANIGINATAISTTNTNLAQLTTRVGSAESAVSQNATAISGLNGRTASLESSVSTQGASIVTLQQATSTIGGDLATLTTRVTAGSANLLRTGGLDAGTLDWSSEGTLSLAYSASFGRWLHVTSGAANFFINSTAVQVDPGGAYTASVDTIFQASAGTMIASLVWLNSGGTEVGRALGGNRGGHSFDNSNAGRATNAASGIAPANASSALLQVSWNNVAGLVNAGLRQAKIENYPTWTPFSSEASIRSAYTAISTLDTQYAGLSTTVGTQGASIVQNATAITNLTGRTASLESSVSTQGASIVTLQQATSTISGDVASLTTRVTASAPNLLPQGGFANGMADWGNPAGWTSSSALDPNWGRYVSVNATGNTYAGTPVQPAQPNQQYTISADIDRGGTNGGAVFARIVWTQAGNVHSVGPMAVKYAGGFSNDEAARVWGTGACPSDANGFYVQLGVEGVTGYQHFRRIKVNVGNYPARFTEEASIVQSFQALSTLTTQYASLSSTVSTQGASISSQATAITTLQGNYASLSSTVSTLNASVATQQSAITDLQGRTNAYWQVTAVAGGRAQLRVYADSNGGGGVDIVGDLRVTGNALIDGTVNPEALALQRFVKRLGPTSISATNTIGSLYSGTLGQTLANGSYLLEGTVGFTYTCGRQTSTYNGKPYYIDYLNDGGVLVRLYKNGTLIASTGWSGPTQTSYGSMAYGSAMTTNFDAPAADTLTGDVTIEVVSFKGNVDTGIVNQGDYYTRQVSGSYSNFSFSNLKLKWTFI